MKFFKRDPAAEVSRPDGAFLTGLYAQLEDTIAVYRRLSQAHTGGADADQIGPEALGWARAGALTMRYADAGMQDPTRPFLSTLPQTLSEGAVLALLPLDRLCYGLCALAEDDVVEEALLRPAEADRMLESNVLKDWLAWNREGMEAAVADGHPPPDPFFAPEILEIPYLPGGKTMFREVLLMREGPVGLPDEPDAPQGDIRAMGFSVAGLYWAMLILVIHHGALYLDLLRDYEDEGPSSRIDATAISAAVDVALVQQSIWQRLDLLGTMRHTPLDPGAAMGCLDDLFFSFLVLTGRDPVRTVARFDAEAFQGRLRGKAFLDWIEAWGYRRTLPAAGLAAIREAREEGADDDELLELTLSTIERAQIAAPD